MAGSRQLTLKEGTFPPLPQDWRQDLIFNLTKIIAELDQRGEGVAAAHAQLALDTLSECLEGK